MAAPPPPLVPRVSAATGAPRGASVTHAPSAAGPAHAQALPLAHLLELAADVVHGVQGGRSATDLLARVPVAARPAVQALAFDVLRRWGAACAVRARLAPKKPPPAVDALLCSALALAWPQADPPYAEHTLVDQAVEAATRRVPAAAGFVNAVLRRFLRERAALVAAAEHDPVAAFNHQPWWIERLRHDWPMHWRALLEAANERPPMTLRVNRRRSTGADYALRVAATGRQAWLLADARLGGQAVVVDPPCPVAQLPGFAGGDASVQDAAAQLATELMLGAGPDGRVLAPDARVLDACAAPGGKTAALLESAELRVLAIDSDPARLPRIHETLTRLQLAADVRAADARRVRDWWDGEPFDAVLLDAPCSASGIVRRHPDIRWLRRADDLAALARTQAELLDALWPLVKPGGRLVYATCSVFKAEGEQQIDAFLQRQPRGTATLDPASPGHLLPLADNPAAAVEGPPGGRRVLPDGFYYARLFKH